MAAALGVLFFTQLDWVSQLCAASSHSFCSADSVGKPWHCMPVTFRDDSSFREGMGRMEERGEEGEGDMWRAVAINPLFPAFTLSRSVSQRVDKRSSLAPLLVTVTRGDSATGSLSSSNDASDRIHTPVVQWVGGWISEQSQGLGVWMLPPTTPWSLRCTSVVAMHSDLPYLPTHQSCLRCSWRNLCCGVYDFNEMLTAVGRQPNVNRWRRQQIMKSPLREMKLRWQGSSQQRQLSPRWRPLARCLSLALKHLLAKHSRIFFLLFFWDESHSLPTSTACGSLRTIVDRADKGWRSQIVFSCAQSHDEGQQDWSLEQPVLGGWTTKFTATKTREILALAGGGEISCATKYSHHLWWQVCDL